MTSSICMLLPLPLSLISAKQVTSFGGTDGVMWYNDVWTYDPRTNAWTQLDCIGFIPAAREGHAAALVDNVMYTFGGRTEEGKDLGDVAGFRIPTRRWYTFQNMGPSPSPRSGHGMTAYENRIVVLGGEPSSAPRNEIELSEVYILDTSKIRYPVEPAAAKSGVTRRPSVTDRSGTPQQDRAASRDGSISSQPGGRSLTTKGSQDSMLSNPASYTRPADAASNGYTNGIMQKPTRSAPSPAPGQAAPQALQQSRANGVRVGAQSVASEGRGSPRLASKLDRAMSPDQTNRDNTPAAVFAQQRARADSHPSATASYGTSHDDYGSKQQYTNEKQQQQQYPNGQQQNFNEQQQYSNEQQQYFNEKQQYPSEKQQQAPSSQQPPLESSLRSDIETPETGVRSADEYMQSNFKQPIYADSGVGSSPALSTQQPDGLVKELEAARSKNAWYESELALAKKSGYRSSSLDSPTSPFDDKTANAFGDEEKPLLEALLRMRAELVRVQQSLETQSTSAAERMAQIEKEKEAAVSEALYARTQLSNNVSTGPGDARGFARLDDTNRRLASTLNAHNDLKMQIQSLSQSLAAERQARETAEASAEAAHSRATTLDSHKKWSSTEIESLRAQLSEAQRDARDLSERHAEAYSSSRSLDVEKQELTTKLNAAQEAQKNHIGVLTALRAAVQASNEKSGLIERQLEQERQQRSTAEQKLTQLRAEHETRMAELESATKSLRDTQDLAESHASEARTHREAVLAGLGSTVSRDYDPSDANDERVSILQQQVEEAGARAQQLKEHADGESYRRRRAEERIAGLEAFQEQQNRESLGLRKQLQGATRDHVTLHGSHAELQQQLQKHKLDITAWEMHHESLKNVLGDRGVDTSDFPRDASELQLSTNNNKRIQQLEEQIEAGNRSQDEMRQTYEIREQELRQTRDAEYRALEKECQQMRNGIEKFNTIASTMKKELDKQKEKNRTLREELDQEKHSRSVSNDGQHQSAAEFENERSKLRQLVDNLQTRLQKSQSEYDSQVRELQSAMSERDHHQQQNQQLQRQLASSRQASTELENLRAENQELRTRTTASEKKVQSLLDTVGSSVNNYRRQSQSMPDLPNGPVGHTRGISSNSIGGDSNYSTHSTTNGLDGNRNSLAQMEAMMNELDSIRGDFERQRQEYSGNRLSTGSMLEGPGPTAGGSALEEDESSAKVHSLADMRRRHLSFDEEDDVDESQTRRLQALA